MIDVKALTGLPLYYSDTGVIRKWYDDRNKLFIRASNYFKESGNYHVEAVMECIACDIGTLLGVNVVPYWLDTLVDTDGNRTLVCVSKDYKSTLNISSRISARALLVKLGLSDLRTKRSERYKKLISYLPSTKTDIDKMVVFDYLIDNYDRHMNNFEFCRLNNGVTQLSPIYDNGLSLLSDWISDEDLSDLNSDEDLFEENILNAETPSKCFAMQHDSELSLIDRGALGELNMRITEKQIDSIVHKYKNFLTPTRLESIAILLKARYANILRLNRRNKLY